MVLRKNKKDSDVLIIDASKGFEKDGKNNKLRACDIKRIVDAYKERPDKIENSHAEYPVRRSFRTITT